ncbi:pyrroloquinoline quinone precursor peptide PqqA [Streptomyces sp. NPDC059688]|uniref:Coenzyme PQQ synthesis protein A n=2 Tax=Streptomyces TaxID=1883 RepID=A0ABY6F0E7_9ACTN|nr:MULTISPECIES: pyrroloquinoline quinone precursor peptide PqqA [unclassified Streptomyces]UXY39911.1 pyrroloquinoline quinone precursor peptide PqqA [Streptomyces sp. HUAS 14-6]
MEPQLTVWETPETQSQLAAWETPEFDEIAVAAEVTMYLDQLEE